MVKEVYWNCKYNWVWEKNLNNLFCFVLWKIGFWWKKKYIVILLKYNIKILDLDNFGLELVIYENNF